jgi:hypothetical protein
MLRHLLVLLFLGAVTPAYAWGPLGHRMVAETAALLIADQEEQRGWGPFLFRHRFEMGYYAIVPDALYRTSDGNDGKLEAPTHFFDIDLVLGALPVTKQMRKDLAAIPRDFEGARKHLEAKHGRDVFPGVGTAPWRTEQFQELAWSRFKSVKEVKGTYQTGAKSEGDARLVYEGLYYLGVLSHYTGDSAMPYHATSDWNGWKVGAGGIHFYFENDCVNYLEPGLSTSVLRSARQNGRKWRKEWGADHKEPPAGIMLRMFLDSAEALTRLQKLDHELIVEPSDEKTKKAARRKPYATSCRRLEALIIERLAKASVLTATIWNHILPVTGVDFSRAETLQFADFDLTPPYVKPSFEIPSFLKSGGPAHFPWQNDTH